jgi:flagellar biosynthesis protein FlhF
MKIKRFTAKNMREAIRMVREEQGPDAVILSNRRINGGIEVVAAVDYDEALMQASLRRATAQPGEAVDSELASVVQPEPRTQAQPAAKPAAKPAAPAAKVAADEDDDGPFVTNPNPPRPRDPLTILLQEFGDLPLAPSPVVMSAPSVQPMRAAAVIGNTALAAVENVAASAEIVQLREELGGMRKMLEQRLATLAWNDLKHNRPQRYAVLRVLSDLGIEPELAQSIAEEVPEAASAERARFLPLGMLARRIPVAKNDWVLDGGVIALVGPTGVGKTTTIAKLAARYAEAHGLRDIALVAMDHYRIGAAEQLYTYARLLGVPVHAVTPQQSLKETLARVADRKLVLIDTVGMSPRDGALASQIDALHAAHPKLRAYLTIAANNQTLDQDEAVRRFGVGKLAGCIISKLDETSRIGGALSVAIRHQLPITYFTDGQRVPEDLHLAKADALVIRAMQLARTTPAPVNDDTLALQFAHAIETGAHAHV